MLLVPYRVKRWPRRAGALLPWIVLWQLTQPRAISRVFGLAELTQLPLLS